jgi:amidase
MNPLLSLSGTAQARLIRAREVSSREVVEAHIDRIHEVNPAINAVVEVWSETALQAADEVDSQRTDLPLAGVPFSVKDSIEVRGTVCTAGTLGYRHNAPSARDATLVAKLRAAGAIPLARTNLPDLLFAFETDNFIHGRTNNPYDLTRTSGGSSGGEAALLAACGSPFGLGSDAAGSVRLPAHYCGVASLKPTSGRLSRTGHVPPAGGWIETLWQIGPMARRVEDLITMLPLLLGPDGEDRTLVPMPLATSPPLNQLRIAFFTDNGILAADAATTAAVHSAAKALADAGARAEERRPPAVERSYDLEMRFLGPDGGDGLREFLTSIGSGRAHPLLYGWLDKLEQYRTDVAGFAKCWSDLDSFRQDMNEFLQTCDVLLSPVAAFPAVPHGQSINRDIFPGFSYTMTHNLTGWPASVVRCGVSPGGLPIGVQISAAPWREDITLSVAKYLEDSLGGWQLCSD